MQSPLSPTKALHRALVELGMDEGQKDRSQERVHLRGEETDKIGQANKSRNFM